MDALIRQWHILRNIPKHPRRIDIGTLRLKLADLAPELSVSRRTIERDMHKLSMVFELTTDNHRPQGWSLLIDEQSLAMPRHKVPRSHKG